LKTTVFPLKTHHFIFSVHSTLEKYESATIIGHFGFVFEVNSGMNSHSYHGDVIVFSKAPFSKCFSCTPKRKAGGFEFLRFEERFRKAPFS